MQQRLTALGLYSDKLDGKAGMLTRSALGAYQKKNGLKVDCWPTADVLTHMQPLKTIMPGRAGHSISKRRASAYSQTSTRR